MSRAFPSDRAGLKAMAVDFVRLFHSPVTRGASPLGPLERGGEAVTVGVSIVMGVIVGLTVLSLAVGVLIGWLACEAARGPTPYITLQTPEAEAYRKARGLPPGAPIPSRDYWRAVARGEITPEPWVKTPAEMAGEG